MLGRLGPCALLALVACGRTGLDGGPSSTDDGAALPDGSLSSARAGDGGLSSTFAEDGSLSTALGDDGGPFDASPRASTCNATPPPPPVYDAGTYVCTFPSGRTCVGTGPLTVCQCDDQCNACVCTPEGWGGTTDVGCGPSVNPPACTGALSPQCTRGGDAGQDVSCTSGQGLCYCAPWVLEQCGADVCPDRACTLDFRDDAGGSLWCCP
jgi:hypothetical protein